MSKNIVSMRFSVAAAVIGAALVSTPALAGMASHTTIARSVSPTMTASNIGRRDHRGPRGVPGGGVSVSPTVNCIPRHPNDKRCRNAAPIGRVRK